MKHLLSYTLILLSFVNSILAQQNSISQYWCSSTEVMNTVFAKHPDQKQNFENYQNHIHHQLNNASGTSLLKTSATANYTIPVVFHVLHLNGAENISDAQINDAIHVLNIDFAKQNTDFSNTIPAFISIASSSIIRFSLAKKDPNGNCTSGIVRHYDIDANWNDNTSNYSYTWDPTKYLNVYIVKTISMSSGFNAAGFTYLPGSWSSGAAADAIVLLHNYTGTIGTSNNSHNHVLTHEVGHWLGLPHTFGWNSCGVDCNNDDNINDTPTTPGYLSCPNSAIPSSYQLCTPGISENFQNIMDYSYCSTMFTYNQVARMEAETQSSWVGRDNLGTTSNLSFTGISPIAPCAPVANFQSNKQIICPGESIYFSDLSNVGTPTTWQWSFQGGNLTTSSVQNPTITYNNPGTYSVQLIASNVNGSSTPIIKTNYITVLQNPITSSLVESFEGNSIPNSTWFVRNSQELNSNWSQTSMGSATGSKSAFVSESVAPISTVELYSPSYNFSGMPGVALTLKWAGAERDQSTTSFDAFTVQFSTNCGVTWGIRLSKNIKASTSGVSGVVNGNFQPSSSQFVQEVIPISSFSNESNISFKLKFVSETGLSNNFYVDDINLTSLTDLKEQYHLLNLSVFPNPANEQVAITFDLLEDKKVFISLHDLLGKMVKTVPKQNLTFGHYELPLSISDLSKGIYFIKIHVNDIITTEKLIID